MNAAQRPPAGRRAPWRLLPEGHARLSLRGLFAVGVWGASFVATRIAIDALTPAALVSGRLLLGAAVLFGLLRWHRGRRLPARGDWYIVLLLGGVLGGHLLLQAYGLIYTSAINTGWIIALCPVAIALGAQLLGQQRLRLGGWLGVGVATAGVLLLTLKGTPDLQHATFGDLLQLISCFTWTCYALVAVGVVARNGALPTTAAAMSLAAVLTLPLAAGSGWWRGTPTAATWVALLFLGPICSGLAYHLYFAATRDHGPTRIAALIYLEPFVTVLVATTLGGETIQVGAILGGLTILAGVWLVAHGARPAAAAERT